MLLFVGAVDVGANLILAAGKFVANGVSCLLRK